MVTLLIFSVILVTERYRMVQESVLLDQGVTLATKISIVIHELQKERGTSAGFLGSKGKNFGENLQKQRQLSDEKIKEFFKALYEGHKNICSNLINMLSLGDKNNE